MKARILFIAAALTLAACGPTKHKTFFEAWEAEAAAWEKTGTAFGSEVFAGRADSPDSPDSPVSLAYRWAAELSDSARAALWNAGRFVVPRGWNPAVFWERDSSRVEAALLSVSAQAKAANAKAQAALWDAAAARAKARAKARDVEAWAEVQAAEAAEAAEAAVVEAWAIAEFAAWKAEVWEATAEIDPQSAEWASRKVKARGWEAAAEAWEAAAWAWEAAAWADL